MAVVSVTTSKRTSRESCGSFHRCLARIDSMHARHSRRNVLEKPCFWCFPFPLSFHRGEGGGGRMERKKLLDPGGAAKVDGTPKNGAGKGKKDTEGGDIRRIFPREIEIWSRRSETSRANSHSSRLGETREKTDVVDWHASNCAESRGQGMMVIDRDPQKWNLESFDSFQLVVQSR